MNREKEGAKRGRHSNEARRERLAAELRSNLEKRKAQARARNAQKAESGSREPGDGKRWPS